MLHPWHGVGVGEQAPEVVTAIIEVPRGSNIKYELDKASGLHSLQRRALSGQLRVYPAELLRRQRSAGYSGAGAGTCSAAFHFARQTDWRNENV